MRGLGITFIVTGLMGIGFLSFGGMLTGDDAPSDEPKTVDIESVKTIKIKDKEEIVINTNNKN